MRTNKPTSDVRRSLTSIGRLLVLVLGGCAPEADAEPAALAQVEAVDGGDLTVDAGAPDAREPLAVPVVSVPRYPSGWPAELPKVVSVKSNGTGCPSGSVDANVSPDGTLLTVSFSALEASVSNDKRYAVKDCQLVFTLQSGTSFRYTAEVTSSGYGYLEQGVNARQVLRSLFAGSAATDVTRELTGPFDDWFQVTNTALPSACATERDLTVHTVLRLVRSASGGSAAGYVNLAVAHPDAVLKIKLGWQRCE